MNMIPLCKGTWRKVLAILLALVLCATPVFAVSSDSTATEVDVTEPPAGDEPTVEGGDTPGDAPTTPGLPATPLTLEDFGIYETESATTSNATTFRAAPRAAQNNTPTYLNPQTMVVSVDNENNAHSGSPDRDLNNYLFAEDAPAPIEVRFDIETLPVRNAYIAIHAWDCDETSTTLPEYDAVYVNGTKVGVMTGQNGEWNTTLLAVPVSALQKGANYVTIHIGAKNTSTGEIYEYYARRWAIEVKWVQLLLDGGANESKPEEFYLSLQNAFALGRTVLCEAAVHISSKTARSYELEYNLVDRSSPDSPSYLQIISTDSDTVRGDYIEATGLLRLSLDAMSGEYSVQALLKDPVTNEILAVDEAYFDFETGKIPSFDVAFFTASLDPIEYTSGPVTMNLLAMLKNLEEISGITFAVNGEPVAASVTEDGVATASVQITENGLYRVEVLYTKDGVYHSAKEYITVDNIIDQDFFFEYSINGGEFKRDTSASVHDIDAITIKAYKKNADGSAEVISSNGNPYTYYISGDVYESRLANDTISLLFHGQTTASVGIRDNSGTVHASFEINVEGADYYMYHILNDDAAVVNAATVDFINRVDTLQLYAFARYDDGTLCGIFRDGDVFTFEPENALLTATPAGYTNVEPSSAAVGNSGVNLKKYDRIVKNIDIEILSLEDGADILLTDIADGKLSADDERMMKLVEEYLKSAGLSNDRAASVVDAVKNAPHPYDELYVFSLFEYVIESTSNPSGSFFRPSSNGLNLGANTSSSAFLNTWFHESGHALDWVSGNGSDGASQSDVAYNLLVSDLQPGLESMVQDKLDGLLRNILSPGWVTFTEEQTESIINNLLGADNAPYVSGSSTVDPTPAGLSGDVLKIYERSRDAYIKELSKIAYSNAEMGADVNGGLCNNTIRGNFGHSAPFGVSTDNGYWFSGSNATKYQCLEAWAEFFSAKMIGDTAAQNRNASYFPATCAYFEELAEEMLAALKAKH